MHHPTYLPTSLFRHEDRNALFAAITCPTLVLTASDDEPECKPNGAMHDRIRRNGVVVEHLQFHEFEDQETDFVQRGQRSQKRVHDAIEEALEKVWWIWWIWWIWWLVVFGVWWLWLW